PESNFEARARDVESLIRTAADSLRATGKKPGLSAPSQARRKGSEPLATDPLPFDRRPGGAR
ncbi:replication protein, partial [Xanthobacter autotrophicus]